MDVGIQKQRYFVVQVDLFDAPQEALDLLGGLIHVCDNQVALDHLKECVTYCEMILQSKARPN